MCNCTESFDIRCRCQPFIDKEFFDCPVRKETWKWIIENDTGEEYTIEEAWNMFLDIVAAAFGFNR